MSVRKLQKDELTFYADDLYKIAVDSLSEYPVKYRNIPAKESFLHDLLSTNADIWICTDKETNILCGYSWCGQQENMVHLWVVKVMPAFLKKEANAAIAYKICCYYLNELGLKYVCDGERNIRHETNYQDFLVKVLGFRYAFCKLHVVYNPFIGKVVKCIYPFGCIIKFLSKYNSFIYNISCVLKQEQIAQTFNK